MKEYRSSERIRTRALAYYYDHRELILKRLAGERRQMHITERHKMTREEKLARRIVCKGCERQVTTPSALLRGRPWCSFCRKKQRIARFTARGLTTRGTIKRIRIARANIRFTEYKSTLQCSRCGFGKGLPRCLDFHHRPGTKKSFALSVGRNGYSWATLMKEVAKCDVLCANCHRLEHQ